MSEEKRTSAVSFAAGTPDSSSNNKPPRRRSSMRGSLRSSFFRLKNLVFRRYVFWGCCYRIFTWLVVGLIILFLHVFVFKRNDGEAGADIATLRGSHGPDFEGKATITRGGIDFSCFSCFGKSYDTKEKIILIKGAYCFVFGDESDQSPKYAIALAFMKVNLQAPSHGVHYVTVETSLGDVEWELGFQEKEIAQKFVEAFKKQAAAGEADKAREVRRNWIDLSQS